MEFPFDVLTGIRFALFFLKFCTGRKGGKMKKPMGCEKLTFRVRDVLVDWLGEIHCPGLKLRDVLGDGLGKMLRTRFASCALEDSDGKWPVGLEHACAAVELIHTASLFHDDVVDGATLRRGKPALWKVFSQNGAILIGDILFCEALSRLSRSPGSRFVGALLGKGREVCIAEAEQEIRLRGSVCDFATCLRIARGKTGPLFAFTGLACGDGNQAFSEAMEEAGYRIGTAYQLADDLIDESGDEIAAGKTLGTDRLRRKYTLAQEGLAPSGRIEQEIFTLCESSLRLLLRWPAAQAGLQTLIGQALHSSLAHTASNKSGRGGEHTYGICMG
jgi:heptaprenyl diphosphate synthase